MKKIKYIILALIFLIPVNIKAAVIHCSAPSSVESGDTFNVTFSGSLSSDASLWIASIGSEGNASYVSGNLKIIAESKSMSQTVTFRAGNPGSASFYAYDVDVSDGNESYTSSDRCSVTITSATSSSSSSSYYYDDEDEYDDEEEDKSTDYSLKSLSIENIKINPEFNAEKLEYSAIVDGNIDKINVKAEANDEKATVEGIGERKLDEGINKIEIVVTAEDGGKRTYTINVTRKEKNPIEVIINKKRYTVIKKDIKLTPIEGFVKTTVVIEKEEVEAYSNSYTGDILVALVAEDGKAGWFIYNSKNQTYTKFVEFKSNNLRLAILTPNKKDIPHRYKKIRFSINGEEVEGYALEYGSPFRLVYAINLDTGSKNFYLYDMEDNTFQRFYNTQVNIYIKLVKKLGVAIIGLLSLLFIFFIIIICQFIINRKIKKIVKRDPNKLNKVEVNDNKTKKDEIKESKREKKLKEKEEKKKLEKEKRDFLDL